MVKGWLLVVYLCQHWQGRVDKGMRALRCFVLASLDEGEKAGKGRVKMAGQVKNACLNVWLAFSLSISLP